MYCPQCGARIKLVARFCEACGAPLASRKVGFRWWHYGLVAGTTLVLCICVFVGSAVVAGITRSPTPTSLPATATEAVRPRHTIPPTNTPRPTEVPDWTETALPTPTLAPTDTPRSTRTPRPSLTPTRTATPQPTAQPTALPTAKPTRPPTAKPTAPPTPPPPSPTPPPPPGVVNAWVSVPNPARRSPETVFGQLLIEGVGVPGAQMYCIVHYLSYDRRFPEDGGFATTDNEGIASTTFSIGGATSGYTVLVDVYISYAGQTYHATTSFTPQ